MPIAAVIQIVAAVVRPRTMSRRMKITPAPRKPTPETTWAAIRDGSRFTSLPSTFEKAEPGHEREDRGPGSHQGVRPDTGALLPQLPLDTDQHRQHERDQQQEKLGPGAGGRQLHKAYFACFTTKPVRSDRGRPASQAARFGGDRAGSVRGLLGRAGEMRRHHDIRCRQQPGPGRTGSTGKTSKAAAPNCPDSRASTVAS